MAVRRLACLVLLCLAACGDDDTLPVPTESAVGGSTTERPTMGGMDAGAFLLNEDCFVTARDPAFVAASDAHEVGPNDGVLGLVSPGRVIAIPLRLLAYHRVAEFDWGQQRVLVTFAPLRGTASTYVVPQSDRAKGFGIAGHLRSDLATGASKRAPEVDLLLYDARKRSLWSQATGGCLAGWRRNETLRAGPAVAWSTWRAWRTKHPDTQVMSPVSSMQDRYPREERVWTNALPIPSGLATLPRSQAITSKTWIAPRMAPGIDDATWVAAKDADHVKPGDDIVAFDADGRTAVPLYLLAHHHVLNTRLGGEDLAITLCDLCSVAQVFLAQLHGQRLTFDPVGAYAGAALFRDRQTGSRWSVVTGECVFGWHTGEQLALRDSQWTTWGAWTAATETSRVLAPRDVPAEVLALRDGGLRGTPELPPSLVHTTPEAPDLRLPAHELVLAVRSMNREFAAHTVVFPYIELIRAGGVAHDVAGVADVKGGPGGPLVVFYDTASQTARAYSPTAIKAGVAQQSNLRFRRAAKGAQFVDEQTQSTWTIEGHAIAGPLAGTRLLPPLAQVVQIEWYAWSAQFGSRIWTAPKR